MQSSRFLLWACTGAREGAIAVPGRHPKSAPWAGTRSVVLVAMLLSSIGCSPGISPEIRELTPRAEFVFTGTVQLKGSSTMLAAEAKDLAVVRIDDILKAPEIFRNLQRQQVTVRMKDPAGIETGQRRMFFANGWLFAESLAVVEVGSVLLAQRDDEMERLRSQVEQVVRETETEALKERLSRASLVVHGRVRSVAKDPAAPPLATEHDPDWWQATIEVRTLLKGNAPEETLIVSFAQSSDVMWMNAPKLETGQEGIWILHEVYPEGFKAPYPAPLDPGDARPTEDLERIREALR